MNTILKWSGVVALVILAITFYPKASATVFGSSANGGNVTNFDAVSVLDAFYVNDVSVLSASTVSPGTVPLIGKRTASLNQASTTVCALLPSASATTTLVTGTVNLSVSSTTASTVTIAKSSTAFATTTLINSASVSANAQATVLAASTTINSSAQADAIFAPGQYLVVSLTGGTGTFSPTGTCSAVFQSVI